MSRFLIATAANDIHAVVVSQALRHLGNECFRWVTSDYPVAQRNSVTYDSLERVMIKSAEASIEIDLSAMDFVFWN